MTRRTPYYPVSSKGVFPDRLLMVLVFICFFSFASLPVTAIDEIIEIELSPIVSFDDVPVDFVVNGYLKFETDVIITESNKVYIDIEDLFLNMGLKCVSTNEGNSLSGFIGNEKKTYTIDYTARLITVGKNTIKSANGIVQESGAIYVESTVLTEAFGLNIVFNFRTLSIKMESGFELPVLKKMRLEQARNNIAKLQQKDKVADTIVKRDYHLLRFGTMDWSLASYQNQDESANNRVILGLGAEVLYGQANVSVYYDDKYKFDKRQLYFNWRWVDNDINTIRQAQLGKIYNQSISFLEAPLVGAAISNTPTTVRKASGYYTINEYTEPNWNVELYINDVLVDYTVADASGLFVFKVPIVYGYTTIKLKFYGPMGEERIEERTRNVPFTFMPGKTLEYSASGGVLQDSVGSRFGRVIVNYGINNNITLGGGIEYLSSIPDYPYFPFATLAFQPFSKMVMNFEYAHHVKMQGLLSYSFGRSASFEVDYADFVDGQMATRFNANEELKVRLSLPFKMNTVSGYSKFNYNQFVYDAFTYNQFDAVFSGYYKNYNANLSTLFNWISKNEPYITSNLSLSYRMKNGLIFRPSAEYNISNTEFLRYRAEIEKRVAKAYFSVSYERNLANKTNNVFVNFRYDLPFARAGVSASYNNNKLYLTENAEGSIAFGANKTVKTGNVSSLGKGGILFYPFLDLNNNGYLDDGEPMVLLSNVRVNGGKATISKKDSIVRVSDLNAFVNYNVEFNNNDLNNIAWRFKHKVFRVLVDPNQYKKVYVPILSVGEINGMVYLKRENDLRGLGRITIQIYNKQGVKVAETLSERDGYYSYLGLTPNDYTVRIDEEQLKKLNYKSTPLLHKVVINNSVDGDIKGGLDFVLQALETTSSIQDNKMNVKPDAPKLKPAEKVQRVKIINTAEDKTKLKSGISSDHRITVEKSANDTLKAKAVSIKIPRKKLEPSNNEIRKNINPSFGKISEIDGNFYTVQIGVYRNYITAKQLKNVNPIFYQMLSNGTNKYFTGTYTTSDEAEKAKQAVNAKGIKGAYVVRFQNDIESRTTFDSNTTFLEKSHDKNTIDETDFIVAKTNENK